jgi:hypothetical protein
VKSVCERTPWGMGGMLHGLRGLDGRSGVLVYGWFPRPRWWGWPKWSSVRITIDGTGRGVVLQDGPRHLWIDLPSGTHVIGLHGPGQEHQVSHEIRMASGRMVLIAVKTPNWLPWGERGPVWCPPRDIRARTEGVR